jgi:protein-disulfide isomerase
LRGQEGHIEEIIMGSDARRKAREERQAAAALARKRAQQRKRLFIGGGVIIAGLLVAIVVALINAAGSSGTPEAQPPVGDVVVPANTTAKGAITVGKADAPVKLEIYLDYMCPYCGRFERANSAEIERLVADGTVRLEMYPLSFLDQQSAGTQYSTRAANAVATVADQAPDKVLAFNAALFGKQPAEGKAGLTDSEIANLATGAGVPAGVSTSFHEGKFQPWVATSTDAAFKSGISGTPTVRINGKDFKGDLYSAGPLTTAIMAAKG